MMRYTPLLFLLLIATSAPAQQPPAVPPGVPVTPRLKPPAKPVESDNVTITFPKNSVLDVIAFYEVLTGKRIIRDSNLAGQELSIMISKPVSREDAIAIIESSLLLNNYSLVPVDGETVKILGPSRAPRTEGVPVLSEEGLLPQSDQVLSFYKPLAFLTPEDAIAVLQGVIQMNAYGALVPVPNTNAVIITDKTAVIEKALAVLKLIDVEPARVVTEFVTLRRANAEKVVEMLDAMFTKNEGGKQGSGSGVKQTQGKPAEGGGEAAPQAQAAAGISNARYENNLVTGQAKFLADKRTNRVLVVTRVENYRYVREVISNLDAAADFEQPFTRKLKYVPVTDILPVLSDMLADPDAEKQVSGGEGASQQQRRNQNQGFGNNTQRGGRNNADTTSGLDRPDRLANETEQGAPQAVTIGEIRLIADSNANSIVVFGPPESKLRTQQILDILDQRPKQVYLAVVIGQLRLGKGLDYGVSYLIRNKGFEPLNNLLGNSATSGIAATAINPNMLPGGVFPNPLDITDPSKLPALSGLSGLTVYGTIADSVDIFARFLETTNRFKTLSRPVVYTTNNRKATILSGQKVPVTSQALTTATGGGISGNGSSIASSIQYQNIVLKLEVVPLINSDGEVNLVIAQTNDNILRYEDVTPGNRAPIISTQEITTSVRVPNGTTIVLGGLISEQKEEGDEGIPYISEIPIIGSLLGGRTQDKIEKRELIVMIQPVVVDSNEEMMKASAYEGDRTPLGVDGQAMTAPLAEQPGPPSVFRPEKKKKSFWPWSKPEYD